ncbi:MAG: hypothetical protein KF795_01250 [Labilithrix sp.]|nr:hypothetical protein [Labilithrix sp.]
MGVLALAVVAGCTERPRVEPARVAPDSTASPSRADGPEAKNSNGTRRTFPKAPDDVPGKMHRFAYADFGPPSLAHSLLGQECYVFGACCCAEPTDSFEVRVVVYAGVDEAAVRARYVTGPETGDYRLVSARAAKSFVAKHLAELESGSPSDRIPELEKTLRGTRERLAKAFP